LIIDIKDNELILEESLRERIKFIYTKIFTLFINLQYLKLILPCDGNALSLHRLESNVFSSNLTKLCVTVVDIFDCFDLLHNFKQLSMFFVTIGTDGMFPFRPLNNTVSYIFSILK